MVKMVERVRSGEEGATAVEYGIMVALIAVVIIAAVAMLGTNLSEMFGETAECIGNAGDPGFDAEACADD